MEELAEWEAFYFFEPWGTQAEDDRWRQMYSLYFGVNAKDNSEQPVWLDRDPEETERKRAIQDTLDNKILAFLGPIAITVEEVEAGNGPLSE